MRFAALLCLAQIAIAAPLLGQSAPIAPQSDPTPAVPIVLEQFEVSAQGDDGYKAANAISGTRFNTALLDLPRPIEVLRRGQRLG